MKSIGCMLKSVEKYLKNINANMNALESRKNYTEKQTDVHHAAPILGNRMKVT